MIEVVEASSQRAWLAGFIAQNHLERQVSRGRMHYPADLPGFVALLAEEPLGLATYWLDGDECELTTLHSAQDNHGAGTALVERVKQAAIEAGCGRLVVITTNDNTRAIRFYHRRGFRLAAVRVGAIDEYRRTLKPEIPLLGNDDIPIRDEFEFEMPLPNPEARER